MGSVADMRNRFFTQRRGESAPAAPEPQPLQHLFIVTYGKSGSTLLMGLLNSLPGYQIMGENNGVLLDLMQFHRKATQARSNWTFDEALQPAHPWYGIDGYPEDISLARMRDLVTDTLLRPHQDTRVAGFKEIRWWKARPVDYLDFLDQLYPGARYILNTRNLDNVARSSWWKRDPKSRDRLESIEANLRQGVESRGERGYHIHYDDYIADKSLLADMCAWLGVEYDQERFDKVMATKHTTRRDQS